MVARSDDPVTLGLFEESFASLTRVMNERRSQLATRLAEVEQSFSRHEQIIQILENVCGARLDSIEAHLKEEVKRNKKFDSKLEFVNSKIITIEHAAEEVVDGEVRAVTDLAAQMTGSLTQLSDITAETRQIVHTLGEADRRVDNLNDRLSQVESNKPAGVSKSGLIDPRCINVPNL